MQITRSTHRRLNFGIAGAAITGLSALLVAAPPASTTRPATPPTQPATSPATQPDREMIELAGERFELEIAASDETRERGLMNRDHIDDYGGMLFIYPSPRDLSFWMKNCPVEMDILFLDAHGVVTAVHRMKPPPARRPHESDDAYEAKLPRYESRKPAQFAIELQAGTVARLKIKAGDKIEMDVKRLAERAIESGE